LGAFFFFNVLHSVGAEHPIRLQPIHHVVVAGYGYELLFGTTHSLADGVGTDFCDLPVNHAGELIKNYQLLIQAQGTGDVYTHLFSLT